MNRTHLKGLIAVVLSTFGYGLMPLLSSIAYKVGTPVDTLLFTRFLVAVGLLWAMVFYYRAAFKTTLRHLGYLTLLSLAGFGLCGYLLFTAYQYISGSLATMIVFLHPAMIIAYEILTGKAKPSRGKTAAMILSLLGLGAILWDPQVHINMTGVLLSLGAALSYAYFCIALVEPKTRAMPSLSITAIINTITLLGYFCMALLRHEPLIPQHPAGIAMAVLLGLVSTAFASLLFYWGVKRVGPSTAALASTFEPVFVAGIGILFLNETLTLRFILGSVLILSALFLLNQESPGEEVPHE